MRKINRNALRFGLGVVGVALGTAMLGHLAPPQARVAADGTGLGLLAAETPAVTPATAALPPAGPFVPAVIEYTLAGGRLVTLGQTLGTPLAISSSPSSQPSRLTAAAPAPVRVAGRPAVRTRRS